MFLALAAFGLMSQSIGSHSGPVVRKHYAHAGWSLEVRHDTFNDRTTCSLVAPRMVYQSGAIGFKTREHRGLSGTWFRIDGGPARRWQELYPDLVTAGVRLETGGLDDPTGGIVWLPTSLVREGREVSIESPTRRKQKVSRFRLKGFADVWAAALRWGCPPDGFTV